MITPDQDTDPQNTDSPLIEEGDEDSVMVPSETRLPFEEETPSDIHPDDEVSKEAGEIELDFSLEEREDVDVCMDEYYALSHVLFQVLELPQEHPIHSAFHENEIESSDDLLTLNPMAELRGVTFSFPDPEDPVIRKQSTIPFMQLKKIEMLKKWYFTLENRNLAAWFSLDAGTFTKFCTESQVPDYVGTPGNNTTTPQKSGVGSQLFNNVLSPISQATDSTPGSRKTPAAEFTSQIKISAKDYQPLTGDGNWRIWNRKFISKIRMQNLMNVLDKEYVPVSEEDIELYEI